MKLKMAQVIKLLLKLPVSFIIFTIWPKTSDSSSEINMLILLFITKIHGYIQDVKVSRDGQTQNNRYAWS